MLKKSYTIEYANLHVHPWKRFFARLIDLYICCILINTFFDILFPNLFSVISPIPFIISILFMLLIEPFFLASIGTTLGKYLFNITVRDLNGKILTLKGAFKRSLKLAIFGFSLIFPFVMFFAFLISYWRLKKHGTTAWDKDTFVVTHSKIDGKGILLIILMYIVLYFFSGIIQVVTHPELRQLFQDTIKSAFVISEKDIFIREMKSLNNELPKKMSENVTATKISVSNNTVTFQFRILNLTADKINKISFRHSMLKDRLSSACNISNPSPTLFYGFNLEEIYLDKNNAVITTILIKPTDCKSSD